MTTDCIDTFRFEPADRTARTVHDSVLAIVIAVVFVAPATLGFLSFFQ